MRLIDADALKDHLEDLRSYTKLGKEHAYYRGETNALKIAIKNVENAPTVDAVPVVHGRWLEDENAYPGPDLSNYVCSSCKRVGGTWIKGLKPENLFTYCPWCGAKMDGERRDKT